MIQNYEKQSLHWIARSSFSRAALEFGWVFAAGTLFFTAGGSCILGTFTRADYFSPADFTSFAEVSRFFPQTVVLLQQLQPLQWTYLLAITLSTGMVALAIYYFGLKRIPASRSTILELTWPISAVFIGYFAFGERLTATQWLGALVLIAIMIQISHDARKAEIKNTPQ